ncbi:Ulp1 family isopeptidase, partial [Mesorhizobium sp. M1399]|uniref:Ulp1 family isopeptidase n=1 Tax=Mesorhizobium sp. M1399 TaxID=2957096 RepID=UPI00333DA459
TPHELRDDAHSAPAWAGPPSFAGPSTPKPPEIEFDGWQHGSGLASYDVINILETRGVAPTWYAPSTRFLINNGHTQNPLDPSQLYTAALQSDGVHLTFHPGAWLDDEQWLDDSHITRDYNLLERELQVTNPDLAARTRLVDPLVAQRLRDNPHEETHWEGILRGRGRRGTDTADFLFLPLNDADAVDPRLRGNHWSLLLFDRTDRDNPVAYHYDSLGGFNDGIAAALAKRLGATAFKGSINRQDNGWDCGVCVLDATRELVGRLAQGLPQPQHLNNLVADRRALQDRLRPP